MPAQRSLLILILWTFAIFYVGNHSISLTDPDEIFYSLSAKEMTVRGEWVTPYIFNQPQFEKPIFIYWLLEIAFKLKGVTPQAARFFPAFFACLGVFCVYALGTLLFNNTRKAFWSAFACSTAFFYIAMGKSVFTDMVFSVLILMALLSFVFGYSNPKHTAKGWMGFFFFSALAVLTKGPLGVVLPVGIVVLWALYRQQIYIFRNQWFWIGSLLGLGIALPWYLIMFQKHGQAFIQEFFINDHWRRLIEAEHRGSDRWYFYPVTMIAGMFPWSIILIFAFGRLYQRLRTNVTMGEQFLLSWILIVFICFQCAHSKLASYILPLFPALALLVGNQIGEMIDDYKQKSSLWINSILLAAFLFLLAIALPFCHHLLKNYVPHFEIILFISAVLMVWAVLIFIHTSQNNGPRALLLQGATSVVLLALMLTIGPILEPYISSRDMVVFVPAAKSSEEHILTSKSNARGVYFYSQRPITVWDENGNGFFSPHPLPMLKTFDSLLEFFKKQKNTSCVLKTRSFEELKHRLPAREFKLTVLAKSASTTVATIEFIANPV